jgi:hypothetical protein
MGIANTAFGRLVVSASCMHPTIKVDQYWVFGQSLEMIGDRAVALVNCPILVEEKRNANF